MGKIKRSSIGGLKSLYKYDNYLRLSQTTDTYKGKKLTLKLNYVQNYFQNLDYSVGKGNLMSFIKNVKRNSFGSIEEIEYGNGLKIQKNYEDYTDFQFGMTSFHSDNKERPLLMEEVYYNFDNMSLNITERTTYSMLKKASFENFQYDKNWQLNSKNSDLSTYKRDTEGRVTNIGPHKITWNDQNLLTVKGQKIFYDHSGMIMASCPESVGNKINDNDCLIFKSRNTIVYKGKIVQLIYFDKYPVGVWVDDQVYPVITDHLGSIKGMFDPSGKELLWHRNYGPWGKKDVVFNKKSAHNVKELEALTVWSFAQLIEIPGVNDKNLNLYWSKSRVYSPQIRIFWARQKRRKSNENMGSR